MSPGFAAIPVGEKFARTFASACLCFRLRVRDPSRFKVCGVGDVVMDDDGLCGVGTSTELMEDPLVDATLLDEFEVGCGGSGYLKLPGDASSMTFICLMTGRMTWPSLSDARGWW